MRIDGQDYRVNVAILLLAREVEATVQTVETLVEGLEPGVTVSILLNGGTNPQLRELFGRHPQLRYYETPHNLGVAGGRNLLFGTEENRAADLVLLLDNDVVPPTDYVRRLCTALLGAPHAGIVGAAVANIRTTAYELLRFHGAEGAFGNRIFKVSCAEVRAAMVGDLDRARLFHVGVHPDFHYAYFAARPMVLGFVGRVLGGIFQTPMQLNHTDLSRSPSALARLRQGGALYPVSNVAGCTQTFRRALIDELGPLDERFNPYGFEDADFALRALRAGHQNYVDPDTWLLHGTDTRHAARDHYASMQNQMRCTTLLAAKAYPGGLARYGIGLKLILTGLCLDLLVPHPRWVLRLWARWRGYVAGLRQSRAAAPGPSTAP